MATTPVFSLTGKVAMVYGGSYGIGKGICAVLSNAGATVVCVARDKEKGIFGFWHLNFWHYIFPMFVIRRGLILKAIEYQMNNIK